MEALKDNFLIYPARIIIFSDNTAMKFFIFSASYSKFLKKYRSKFLKSTL